MAATPWVETPLLQNRPEVRRPAPKSAVDRDGACLSDGLFRLCGTSRGDDLDKM
jgi:hypothetical protein